MVLFNHQLKQPLFHTPYIKDIVDWQSYDKLHNKKNIAAKNTLYSQKKMQMSINTHLHF